MAVPGGAGRLGKSAGKSIQQLFLATQQVPSWAAAEKLLLALGYQASNVRLALSFYQNKLGTEFSGRYRDAVQELVGIDFSSPTSKVALPVGTILSTYCKTRKRNLNESTNGRWENSGVFYGVGKFLTIPGTSPRSLGIYVANRQHVRLRLTRGICALRSRASGIVDAWTDDLGGGQCIPRMVSGGGTQFRLARADVNPQVLQLVPSSN